MARPARSWFQTEKQRAEAKELSKQQQPTSLKGAEVSWILRWVPSWILRWVPRWIPRRLPRWILRWTQLGSPSIGPVCSARPWCHHCSVLSKHRLLPRVTG